MAYNIRALIPVWTRSDQTTCGRCSSSSCPPDILTAARLEPIRPGLLAKRWPAEAAPACGVRALSGAVVVCRRRDSSHRRRRRDSISLGLLGCIGRLFGEDARGEQLYCGGGQEGGERPGCRACNHVWHHPVVVGQHRLLIHMLPVVSTAPWLAGMAARAWQWLHAPAACYLRRLT